MSSPITTTVSHASSHIAQTSSNTTARQDSPAQGNVNANEMARASQAATEEAKANDKARGTSIKQKKTEGSFASQDEKGGQTSTGTRKTKKRPPSQQQGLGDRVNVAV